MSKTFNHASISRISGKMAAIASASPLALNIQSYKQIGEGLYSLIAEVNHEPTAELVFDSVAKMTDGAGRVIEGSIREIPNPRAKLMRCIVAHNVLSKSYNEENTKGLVALAANVLADPTTNEIWNVVGDGESKRIVQTSHDNLAQIFEAKRSRLVVTANLEHGVGFYNGDYVAYAKAGETELSFGYGLRMQDEKGANKTIALNRATGKLDEITTDQVVEALALNIDEFKVVKDDLEAAANLSNSRGSQFIEYMRKLYGDKASFFGKWEDMIRGMAGKFSAIHTEPQLNEQLKNSMAR